MIEFHTLVCQPVDVRGMDLLVPVTTQHVKRLLVGKNKQKVGFLIISLFVF